MGLVMYIGGQGNFNQTSKSAMILDLEAVIREMKIKEG